jgi:hypothetical protein
VFRRRLNSRWALWAFAAALLLKTAMPLLASVSAQVQDKTLVEICTVYGVSLVAVSEHGDETAPAPASETGGAHRADHCALSALPALATAPPAAAVPVPGVTHGAPVPRARWAAHVPDACADWVALLKHGPPSFS